MKVLVMGSTGGSGRAAVTHLLAAGHEVTAFARRAVRVQARSERLKVVVGDAMNAGDVERAVKGHDAVVVALGITENALRVRLFGAANTPLDVRSAGTRNVIAAMQKHGVRKLVVQTSYGVGETRDKLRFIDRLIFKLVLAPQIADTEKQDRAVRESGLDWVIVQPVHLTDNGEGDKPLISADGATANMTVSRDSVGKVLAETAENTAYVRKSIALSSV